jgi:putative addiction module component (TIGR02574 family)
MSTYADVLRVVLSLSPEQRRELSAAIDASLEAEEAADEGTPNLSPAWRAEIARRSAEYDRGEVTPIPWDVVREKILRKYGDHVSD